MLRTFGCQMNEHDSERIAGLLEADGLVSVASEAEADVVVLNTCCIRENAKNFLSENLEMMMEVSEKVKIAAGLGDPVEETFSDRDEEPIDLT